MTDKERKDQEQTDQEQIGKLAATLVAEMMDAINGGIPWNRTVFAAGLAIKAVGSMAHQMEALSDSQVKKMVITAITTALMATVQAVLCGSEEEMDEVAQSFEQPKH